MVCNNCNKCSFEHSGHASSARTLSPKPKGKTTPLGSPRVKAGATAKAKAQGIAGGTVALFMPSMLMSVVASSMIAPAASFGLSPQDLLPSIFRNVSFAGVSNKMYDKETQRRTMQPNSPNGQVVQLPDEVTNYPNQDKAHYQAYQIYKDA